MKLDDAYAQSAHIPQADDYPPMWSRDAEAFRTELGARADLNISYGPTARQTYDVFHCEGAAQGTLIFVHGGYWLRFDKSYWSHFARGALAQNWNVAMVQYDLCPDVRIADITSQIARAVQQIAGKNEGPISLTGHSAGGHLVARMLAPGLLDQSVSDRIARVAPIAPVADLRPLLETSMNEDFKLDLNGAKAESPVLQRPPETPVKIWVGAQDRPVFVEQAQALAKAWNVPIVVTPKMHHFHIIEPFFDADSDVVQYLTLQ